MSSKSILAGLADGECVDPDGEVHLLAELSCLSEDVCHDLEQFLLPLPCQVEWLSDTGSEISYSNKEKIKHQFRFDPAP